MACARRCPAWRHAQRSGTRCERGAWPGSHAARGGEPGGAPRPARQPPQHVPPRPARPAQRPPAPCAQVGVSPENGPDVVERAARALGFPLDTVFRLRVPDGNPHQLAAPPARARPRRAAGRTAPRAGARERLRLLMLRLAWSGGMERGEAWRHKHGMPLWTA